jgi:uncharacterized membrane protein (UPF0127 family)
MDVDARQAFAVGVLLLVAGGLALVGYGQGLYEYPGEDAHERAVVTLVDENGTELATVDAAVADTRKERVQGLSGRESLANGSGMLFVHGEEDEQTYVMREMNFPLDIVFVAANGTVTSIQGAETPPDDAEELTPYTGRAKYVLEVPRGYAARVGLEPGDEVRIEYTG